MSRTDPSAIFTEVVNAMMQELHAVPRTNNTILFLLSNNLNSPILPEIQHLSLSSLDASQMTGLVPALSKMPGLTSLALPRCDISPNSIRFLVTQCPALANLQSLDLSDVRALKSEDLLLLSQTTTLTKLTSLNLRGCKVTSSRAAASSQNGDGSPRIDSDSGPIALFSSPVVKNLTHLNLGYSGIISDSLVYNAIATSPFLSNLVSLDLVRAPLNQHAVAALAASTTLTNLTHLNLSWTSLGDELITKLLSPPSRLAKKLQSINLRSVNLTLSSLQVIFQASPHLTELILDGNDRLGSEGVEFIATHMSNLTKLDLASCKIGNQGYAALAASTTLTNLRQLKLTFNSADAEPIVALVNCPAMANLTHLELGSTHLGPEVLAAIAQSPYMSNLQHLCLHANLVGTNGVLALAQSSTLMNLNWLDLSSNGIEPEGVNALCSSPVASNLTMLDLSENKDLGDSIPLALAAPTSTLYHIYDATAVMFGPRASFL
jgi:hypothetical protein